MSIEKLPNRMIIFHLDKKCPRYSKVMEIVKDDDWKQKLGTYGIDVSLNTDVANKGIFKADFYNYDMKLIKSYSDGEIEDIFNDVMLVMEKFNDKLEGGYKINYEQKYKKYKKKYMKLKMKN